MSETVKVECFDEVPTRVVCGVGALSSSAACLAGMGAARPLLVCGQNVVRLPQVQQFCASCAGCLPMEVFSAITPDPNAEQVLAGGRRGREVGADVVIGIGGGSSLDAAKAIAAEIGREGWILEQDRPGQPTVIDHPVLPIVCVPTTAGTGSEVNPFAVITYPASERKLVLNHPGLQPRCAVLDPTLLTSAPQQVRMAAGLDALTHAIESYVNRNATEQTRRRAADAIAAIATHLPAAVASGEDLMAQQAMQRAALSASLAFAKTRLGIVHALALPLSALFGVPHGVANAVLLPHGMRFNLPAVPAAFAEIAVLLGEPPVAERSVAAVERLAEEVGAPRALRELGVQEAALERMARDALTSAHVPVNPRQISFEDLVGVYRAAL